MSAAWANGAACPPAHALVVVGDPVNAAQVSTYKPPAPAQKRFGAMAGKLQK